MALPADAETSTTLGPAAQVSVVSFGELLHEVTLMGGDLLPVWEEKSLCVAPEQPGVCRSCFCKGRLWFPMDVR